MESDLKNSLNDNLEPHLPSVGYLSHWSKKRTDSGQLEIELRVESSDADWKAIRFGPLEDLLVKHHLPLDRVELHGLVSYKVALAGCLTTSPPSQQTGLNASPSSEQDGLNASPPSQQNGVNTNYSSDPEDYYKITAKISGKESQEPGRLYLTLRAQKSGNDYSQLISLVDIIGDYLAIGQRIKKEKARKN